MYVAHMFLQATLLNTSVGTVRTGIRLLATMSSVVIAESILVIKLFMADGAHV